MVNYNKYNKTVIYKIECNDLNQCKEVYVGHTTDFLQRRSAHKYDCNDEKSKLYNYKLYETIRKYGGWDNWTMIELEKCPCNESIEAREREQYWYKELNATLNNKKPLRTIEDRRQSKNDWYKRTKSKKYQKFLKQQI